MTDLFNRLKGFLESLPPSPEKTELLNELDTFRPRNVRVVYPYNLTASQQMKYEDVIPNTRDYTAFVNRMGTLVHVMRWGAPHILIRLPGMKLKGTAEWYMRDQIYKALYEDRL